MWLHAGRGSRAITCGTSDTFEMGKGVSVPDAEMLVKLAQLYDVSVNELLGATILETQSKEEEIAKKLAKLNERMVIRNRRIRLLWRVLWVLGIVIFLWGGSSVVFAVKNYEMVLNDTTYAQETGRMVLESCMFLFRKGSLRAVIGLALAVVAGYMGKH